MRILHCSPTPLDRRLGAAKVYIEAAEAFSEIGWTVDLVGTGEIEAATSSNDRIAGLHEYLQRRAGEYDIVEYEHSLLPFPREDFSRSTLMVARSVLLTHHLQSHRIPTRPGLIRALGRWIKGPARRKQLLTSIAQATKTVAEADLVNVCNDDEAVELKRHGIDPSKIIVFPFGVDQARRGELEHVDLTPPEKPCVVFVGTFDPRKGMCIFPRLVAAVVEAVPAARFRLIGTAGMLTTAEEVLAEFPAALRPAIKVIPRFEPRELPRLLSAGSVGVFPSLLEGCPFGVLEMLCAGLPVISFQTPGPPMLLADEYLVERNAAEAMAEKVIALLRDRERLTAARSAARRRSRDFDWNEIIGRTAEVYRRSLDELRGGASA